MCGICGYWSKPAKAKQNKGLIKKMVKTIKHRGPDDEGVYEESGLAIGMTRLSIIDVDGGHQPIHNEKEDVWAVFNGEIYNFKELRVILESKGHKFYTNADTEVLVHGYEEWGKSLVGKLNGMFAFAIWDKKRKILFLARDRIGIKPLYYHFDGNQFIFGSELKAILADPDVPRKINLKALNYYMGFEYVPSPHSIYSNIFKLPAGNTAVLFTKTGELKIEKYWEIAPVQTKLSLKNTLDQLEALLQASVKRRMISDVPLGAFLSGGVDSSLIVSLMAKQSSEPVKTFTIGFENSSYNEVEFAKIVADKFGTDHREEILSPNIMKLMQEISHHYDEPFSDSSAIPTFLICKTTGKKVKVALSGDGGDELFAGYDRYVASKLASSYSKIAPSKVHKKIVAPFTDSIKPDEKKKGWRNMVKRFSDGLSLPEHGGHMRWQYFLEHGEEKKLYNNETYKTIKKYDNFDIIGKNFISLKHADRLTREQYVDVKTYLPDAMLVKIDRASMANSLEVRVPFLDHNVVEFAFNLPSSYRLRNLRTKHILKKVAGNNLPHTIINRKKQGFSSPVKNWIKQEIKDFADDALGDRALDKFFDRGYISKLIEQHNSGKHDHSHKLWAMINFSLWYSRYGE